MATEELSLVIDNPSEGRFLQEIEWNKEEFMDVVAAITEQYEGLTYTEDQMKAAKSDRAKLNAMKKAISDRRIEIKKAVMAPYDKFEAEVKEVVALIEKPISMIDGQIKEYEEKVKNEKKQALNDYFTEIAAEYDFLTFEKIFDQKYLNASVSLNKAKEDIKSKIERIATDIRSIESFTSEKYRMSAMDIYRKTLDVNAALAEDKRLNDLDRKAEEERKRREEEEERRREAEERARAEEELRRQQETEKKEWEEPAVEQTDVSESSENVIGTPENVSEPQEKVSETAKSVSELQESVPETAESVSEPQSEIGKAIAGIERQAFEQAVAPENEKQYKASFTIYGTKDQIMSVKQFMIDNNIRFGKVER